jgi:8-oxo-dGTP pyrophosphatase MutT (NUDIX family)
VAVYHIDPQLALGPLAEGAASGHAPGVSEEDVPIRLAATVVVLRDSHAGAPARDPASTSGPEVLLVQRANELAFHGGAWVFPGGRVDDADFSGVLGEASNEALEVARRAAVREAREESGLVLAPEQLVPVSHWTTPRGRPRRFATWFFAALLEEPAEVVIDGGEICAHRWLRADAALAAREAGEVELPPPTYVTLSMLASYASAASWLAQMSRSEPPIYLPRPHIARNGVISLYHGDVAYEGGEVDRVGPRHRLNMLESGWFYERDPG